MKASSNTTSRAPISLRQVIDVDALCRENPCDGVRVLGSFWPNSRNSFESHVVKSFKECNPTNSFEPHITDLCEFYANAIIEITRGGSFQWIARVLSSTEKNPEETRPQSLLVKILCERTGAGDCTGAFFKSESRPSMRTLGRLSGPDAIKGRIQYVSQDLFIKPAALGGEALLIDDIYNTGASMSVYADALKRYAGIENIMGVNLAATRFGGGRDGHGMLTLETCALQDRPCLHRVWIDSEAVFHTAEDCASAKEPTSPEMHFMAERKAAACPICCSEKRPRKWWQIK